jgi:hypothetical protein
VFFVRIYIFLIRFKQNLQPSSAGADAAGRGTFVSCLTPALPEARTWSWPLDDNEMDHFWSVWLLPPLDYNEMDHLDNEKDQAAFKKLAIFIHRLIIFCIFTVNKILL